MMDLELARRGRPRAADLVTPRTVAPASSCRFLALMTMAVAELTAAGLSNVKIADVLGVAESTVRNTKRPSQNCEPTNGNVSETHETETNTSQNCEPPPRTVEIRRMDFRELLGSLPRSPGPGRLPRCRRTLAGTLAAHERAKITRREAGRGFSMGRPLHRVPSPALSSIPEIHQARSFA